MHFQVILGMVFDISSGWFLRRISHYGIQRSLICHGISGWHMAGPLVRDCKPAYGVS